MKKFCSNLFLRLSFLTQNTVLKVNLMKYVEFCITEVPFNKLITTEWFLLLKILNPQLLPMS